MTGSIYEFLIKAAVMTPLLSLLGAGLWLLGRKAGWIAPERGLNALDMRTWPLFYAVGCFAICAIVFAAASMAINSSLAIVVAWLAAFAVTAKLAHFKNR